MYVMLGPKDVQKDIKKPMYPAQKNPLVFLSQIPSDIKLTNNFFRHLNSSLP